MAESATNAELKQTNGTFSRAYPAWLLFVLMLVNLLNVADRQGLAAAVPALKIELQLSDTHLALILGLGFAIFYTLLELPIARLAEYPNSAHIVALSAAVFSAFACLCATSRSFAQILLYRVGVGAGDAGFGPPVASLLGDQHRERRRAAAMTIIWLGAPLGALSGAVIGGLPLGRRALFAGSARTRTRPGSSLRMNHAWRPIPLATLLALAATGTSAQSSTLLHSGIDTQVFDTSVRPQDDFYQYVNGKWLATTDIPSDRPAYGADIKLYDDAQRALGELIKEVAEHADNAPGSDASKIAALYKSFMDESRVESLGSQPLAAELTRIQALKHKQEIPALMAHLQEIGVTVPFSVSVHLDGMDSSHYAPDLQQDGLGLPDRDYYLIDDATTLRLMRREYQTHIATSLQLLGDKDAAAEAVAIVGLETRLARPQSAKADVRDPLKTYHRVELGALNSLAAGFDWHRYLVAAGISGRIDYVIVSEPDYLRAFAHTFAEIPLAIWKSYFRWRLLSDFSPYLSQAYAEESFAFFGTALQGIPQNQPRSQRGVALVDQEIGQGIGRLYVQKYFPEESKQAAERLVRNLLEAFRQDIGSLGWMNPETRMEALHKLSRITIKIGYPDRWRDYSSLQFRDGDLVGNVMRASSFEFQRSIGKLGTPIDRTEWESSPQAVNAFYSPQMNEIVFPAAILRAPFFDTAVDDAANYGAIGMVIGHEISHAFDDQGSQYDSDGKLRDWWSTEDHERFAALTAPLVNEYNGFMPMRGRQVNGELTLNENIADNAGLAIAHKAYWLSLKGSPAPIIDGLSGEQRFFMGFAQAWREKLRDNFAIELLQSDPHAISFVRVIGTLINQTAFDETFGVKPGDRMYVPPDRRVTIW